MDYTEILGPLMGLASLVLIISIVVSIVKKVKNGRATCKKCKHKFTYPEDFEIIVGSIQWEKQTKSEFVGNTEYKVPYLQYYRVVTFDFKCSKCGSTHYFNKRFNLYTSEYSITPKQEREMLENKIRGLFPGYMFAGKELTLYAADD